MSIWEDPSLPVQLRKADIDAFPIRRARPGKIRHVTNGKARSISSRDAARIAKLVIPPAWRDVRISADPRSHIQAVGRDEAGRRQYIYHRDWEVVRNDVKARRLARLIAALPRIRGSIARDLDREGDDAVLATAARLVDRLCLRAGHEEYAGEESGRGVATLLRKHVAVSGAIVSFDFPGKGKKHIQASLDDSKCARNIARAKLSSGRRLFKLRSGKGYRNMTAGDLNRYLAGIAGAKISAKDFRTLRASSVALERLAGSAGGTDTERRRALAQVAKEISAMLANTPAVTRKSYIHAAIIEQHENGSLSYCTGKPLPRCTKAEQGLHDFLRAAGKRHKRNN
ncbi:DNA topoisomerase IB [Nordella sp. HKS 07]|uniref:DNA topoisomerase IB n=1 Tax=Nordella sp. HKS 07 TaxID=2712222 RepID=UPI0013E1F164|nr:DNA topoisomerase IB [Nordella sp. HKS 07]QIG47430.1 DNA topoisomerase IB [Nordella sp. HKS 07]